MLMYGILFGAVNIDSARLFCLLNIFKLRHRPIHLNKPSWLCVRDRLTDIFFIEIETVAARREENFDVGFGVHVQSIAFSQITLESVKIGILTNQISNKNQFGFGCHISSD